MNRGISNMMVVLVAIMAVLITGFWCFADATTYYVRTDGNNNCTGTTDAAGSSGACAFRTIAKAASVVNAGDTVNIGSGSFAENNTLSRSGSSGSPITFIGTGSTRQMTISASYVIVDGLTFTGASGDGITITGSNNIIKNCTFQSMAKDSTIIVINGANNTITSNLFQNNDSVDVLRVWGHDHNITYNEVKNTTCSDIANWHCDFVQTFGCKADSSYNVWIEGNFVHDNMFQPFMLAMIDGWQCTSYNSSTGCTNCRDWTFVNNIFLNVNGAGFVKLSNAHFFNNVFYHSGYDNGFAMQISTDVEGDGRTGSMTYNNVYINPSSTDTGVSSGTNYLTSSGNPGFVSVVSPYDFHLTAGATNLINKGTNLSTYFTTDRAGNTRSTWDIGAYTFNSVPRPSPPQHVMIIQ